MRDRKKRKTIKKTMLSAFSLSLLQILSSNSLVTMSELLKNVLLANILLQPIQFILVLTTNLLNIRILSSRALRSSPCSCYFLAYAIFSILYNSIVCPTQFLRGFHIDWAHTRLGCPSHFYLLFLFPVQANVMLLLASFDRYCSSSEIRRLHSKSNLRTAHLTIILGIILSAIYMLPMLFIYQWNEFDQRCSLRSNTLINLYILNQLIFYYILAPILMICFGVLTIWNIHQQSLRAQILTTSPRRRRTEGQLVRMLILQITVHLILILPFGITYTMNAFDPSTRTSSILAMRYILVMWQQCDYFLSFFLYVLSGRIYREEFLRLIKRTRFH